MPALATPDVWVRNTYPGPGHVANPGPWGPGQGTDRTEWISFFQVHPTNPKFMLQGTDLGRVVYTNTALGGVEFLAAEMPLRHSCAVAFNPHESGTGYVLMDRGNETNPTGWYRTTDEGVTWEHFFSTPGRRGLLNLLVVNTNPERANEIYIGTLNDGVYRSRDNGATFEQWQFGGMPVVTMSLDAEGLGLYVLTGGEFTGTLHRIHTPSGRTITYPGNRYRHVDMHPTERDRGIIVDEAELRGFTTTRGWKDLNLEPPMLTTIPRLGLARHNPANPDHIVAMGLGGMIGNFQWTTDGGATWNQWEAIDGWSPNFIDYGPSNWRSPEYTYPSGFPPNSVRTQMVWDFLPGDPSSVVLWETGYHKAPQLSTDYGENFAAFAHGGNFKQHAQLDIGSNDLVRAVSYIEAGALLTNDGGRTWRSYHRYNTPVFPGNDVPEGATGLDRNNWRYRSTWGISIDPSNDRHVIAVVGWKPIRILRTTDFGNNWTEVGQIDSATVPEFRDAGLNVRWDLQNPNRVYIYDLRNDDVSQPWTSLDGTFTPVGATTRMEYVASAISPANADLVVHKFSGVLWRFSQDGGDTWVSLPAPPRAADDRSAVVYSAGHLGFAIDPDPMKDPTLGEGRYLRLLSGGEGGLWQYQATNSAGDEGVWSPVPNVAFVPQPGDPVTWLGTVQFDVRPGHHQTVYAFGRYVGIDSRGQLAYRQAYKSIDSGVTWTSLYGEHKGELPDWLTADLANVSRSTGALFITDFTGQYSLGAVTDLTFTFTVNAGSGDGVYDPGTVVNVVADPAPAGQVFDMWTGDVYGLRDGDVFAPETTFTIAAADATLTATYRPLGQVADADVAATFDEPGALAAEFHQTLTGKYSEDATAGLGDTRGLLVSTQGSQGTAILQRAFAGNAAERTLSIHFRYQAAVSGGAQPIFIGIGPTATFEPNFGSNSNTASHHITVGLLKSNSPLDAATLRINSANGGAVTFTNAPGPIELIDGNWYKLSAHVTYDGFGYAVTASLDATDDFGFVVGNVKTHTRTGISVPGLAADPEVYAYFGGQGVAAQRGIQAVDNFVALP